MARPRMEFRDGSRPGRHGCSELSSHHMVLNMVCSLLRGTVPHNRARTATACRKVGHRRWSPRGKVCSTFAYALLDKVARRARSTAGAILDGIWLDKCGHNPSAARKAHRTPAEKCHKTPAAPHCFCRMHNTRARESRLGTEGNCPNGRIPHKYGCHTTKAGRKLGGTCAPHGCGC
mmetsp:Transcript_3090/g.7140  ORF Transcript_3090/g.7140 Transcript_3090/m.7140 type:complete len:176 (+) Transcript_3090:1149-1676(+)